jgi:hypothetical protein
VTRLKSKMTRHRCCHTPSGRSRPVSADSYHPMMMKRCFLKEAKSSGLLQSVNRVDLDASPPVDGGLDPLTKVMIFFINVPSPRAHLWDLGQVNGPGIVLKKLAENLGGGARCGDAKELHLSQQVHHDNGNTKDGPTCSNSVLDKTTLV